jgi:circadian clock protein KaiC
METRSSGAKGLDKLLCGGIPVGKSLLLFAPAGSGKTTLCRSFAIDGKKRGEKVLYISTGMNHKDFTAIMKEAGVDKAMEHMAFIDCYSWRQPGESLPKAENVTVMDSITNLNDLACAIRDFVKKRGGIDRIVLDSLSDLTMYSDAQSVFKFLQLLQGEMTKDRASALLTLEEGLHDEKTNTTIKFICDGGIEMRSDEKRELRVARMTGAKHSLEWAPYEIKSNTVLEVEA